MARAILPILRLRYELDKTLRARAFFARATRGGLQRAEYQDLIVQLRALADTVADRTFRTLADGVLGGATPNPACPATHLLHAVIVAANEDPETVRCIVEAALGTSWMTETAETHENPGARVCLEHLYRKGTAAVDRLGSILEGRDPQPLYAIAELTRGAILGVATYLDGTWPPPVLYVRHTPN